MISDSYELKEIDGIVYEADCRNIQIGGESFGQFFWMIMNGNEKIGV